MNRRYTFKDPAQEVRLFSRRALFVAIVLIILVLCLIGRLVWLQVIQHHFYMTLSRQNHISFVPLEPKRGLIYDRRGVLLAENAPVFSLEIVVGRPKQMRALIQQIREIIPISENEVSLFFKQLKQKRQYQEVPLKVKLTEEEVATFYVNQFRLSGVMVKARLIRHYPESDLFSPVLGYVGRINESELKQVDAGEYAASNYIGKLGIEKYYEPLLHGRVGYQQVEVDAAGHVIRVLERIPPVSGENLYLSIDSHLQRVAQEALKDEKGALVAIDPSNGQVLALVSHPAYDPNLFVTGISSQQYEEIRSQPDQPLYNRALRGQYPVGSTIKPFLALIALDDEIIYADDKIYDPGYYQLKGQQHTYHDWKRTGHGWVNLEHAIAESCDTYFYQLGLKLGIERIDDIMSDFGFGELTQLDVGEELAGLVASPKWKKKRLGLSWFPGDTLNSVIGQGYMLATPLQLAHATATLAARGQGYLPTLLYLRQSESGKLRQVIPRQEERIEVADEHWDRVHAAMQQVIKAPFGTAHYLANNLKYAMAAKTGTAQVFSLKENQKYNANMLPKELRDNKLFIAFAPVENPKIAVAAITEHSLQAGYVTKKVIDAYLTEK